MTVIVSGGKAVAAKSSPYAGSARPQTYRGGRSLRVDSVAWNETYAKIYAGQPWVYAVVNKLSRGVARLPLKSYRRDDAGAIQYLRPTDGDAHPLPVLLSRPYPRGSRFGLIEATVGNLAIYGNAAWWKFRPGPGRAPVELWPLDWRCMTIRTNTDAEVDYYEYDGPAGKRKFLADDIVHFQWWSPMGPAGTSPLEPLRVTLALEDAGRRYAVSSFSNGARPSGAVTTPKTLDPDVKEELRAEIQQMNAGPDAAFRVALMDGGMDWKPFAHTSQEAETIAHRKLNREEVAGAYDMPPPVIQILDNATYSNITEQNKALYRETLGPWTTMLEETIAAQLLWGEPDFATAYTEFDMAEVLKSDLVQRAQAYKLLENTMTVNERRALENRDPIGEIDDEANPANGILLPLNMAVLMPDGSLVATGGTGGGNPTDGVAAALSAAISDEVNAALEQIRLETETRGAASDRATERLTNAMLELVKAQNERPIELHLHEGAIDARSTIQPQVIVPARKTKTKLIRDAEGLAQGSETEETFA